MGGFREHPHQLLWYVSGDLDPRQARETEAHLAGCADCEIEARALASMLEVLRRDYPGGPPVAPRRPGSTAPSPRDSANAQRNGRGSLPGAGGSRWERRALHAGVLVAASLAVLAVPALLSRWTSGQGPLTIREVEPVLFAPPERGSTGERVLPGEGPWAITVVLPFGAPEGRYQMRVERENPPATSGHATVLSTDGQGRLSVVLDSLPEPGRYLMILRSLDAGSSTPTVFQFTTGTASSLVTRSRAGGSSPRP